MIKIADLLINWQNDNTTFARQFESTDIGEAAMTLRFVSKMPECHGVQYADGEHLLRTESGQVLCANSDWSDATAYFTPACDNDFALALAALCARFANYEALLFHASLVDYNGQGLLFVGRSGVGKTTQAELWNKFLKADIINGDKAIIRNINGEFFACGLPWKGSSDYCLNRKVPIKGIVVLNQSKENNITRLDSSSAEMLMPHIFLPHWDKVCIDKALSTFDDLVRRVPVWLLECRPDESAVNLTYKTILL